MNFDQAFSKLIGHEGGYVDDPHDPGMATKYGISKRSHPNEDIENMTLERAKEIYRADYWAPFDSLPAGARFQVFDLAVNSGVRTAIRMVQATVGTKQDGVLGPVTEQAIRDMEPARFIARLNGRRLAFMADLDIWNRFGRGWARRIAQNLIDV